MPYIFESFLEVAGVKPVVTLLVAVGRLSQLSDTWPCSLALYAPPERHDPYAFLGVAALYRFMFTFNRLRTSHQRMSCVGFSAIKAR